jgi:hypothetical protein
MRVGRKRESAWEKGTGEKPKFQTSKRQKGSKPPSPKFEFRASDVFGVGIWRLFRSLALRGRERWRVVLADVGGVPSPRGSKEKFQIPNVQTPKRYEQPISKIRISDLGISLAFGIWRFEIGLKHGATSRRSGPPRAGGEFDYFFLGL